MNFIKPRGTQDLFGEDASNFFQIRELLFFFARAYGLKYIITPIFESKDLFVRSVGTTSDIVKKEFFEFRDKSDRDMVLRPEGTAGVIRSVIENKLINKEPLPLKLFYFGPMFRYERPQSGRLRQFHQFGVEIIGSTKIHDHIEMLLMIRSLLESMEIKKYIINVNNIGTIATRAK
jgi:histidyl-tRNA synthetase